MSNAGGVDIEPDTRNAHQCERSEQQRPIELETRKRGLADSIETERALQQVMADEHSIKTYFYCYANANLDSNFPKSMQV